MASNIEIKIKQLGQGQNSYYTNGVLDLADDSTINTVVQLVDVREPDKRATDFIQTFTLPATKRNNQAFQHIKMKGFQSWGYDPSKKLDCQVLVNGNQYFNGYLQLNSVTSKDGVPTSYEVTVYAKLGSFFNDLGDKTLRDLIDVTDFNHKLDWWAIVRSWGPIGTDPKVGAYKMPDLPPEPLKSMFFSPGITYKGAPKPFQLGFGYVYPPVFVGQTDKTNWNTSDFKPAFYVKTLFDRLLESQGVRYTSNFINSEYFRRLIIPSQSEIEGNTGNAQLTKKQIEDAYVWGRYIKQGPKNINVYGIPVNNGPYYPIASVGTETGKSYGPYRLKYPNDTTAPAMDTGGQYDPATGVLTIKKNGKYNLNMQVRTSLVIRVQNYGKTTSASRLDIQGGNTIPVKVCIRNQAGNIVASNEHFFDMGAAQVLTDLGKPVAYFHEIPLACSFKNQVLAAGQSFYFTIEFSTTGSNYKYKTYDTDVTFWWIGNAGDFNGTMDLYIKALEVEGGLLGVDNPSEGSKFILALSDTSISDGDTLLMNDYLPNIKSIDFIRDLNKAFNLYWKWDEKGFFIIEPRDKFYSGQNDKYVIKDWTYKVDNNEEQTIEPLYDLANRTFIYTYKSDDTYENTDHEDETKEVYGTKSVTVENDFVAGESKTELNFAATPMVDFLGTGLIMPSFTEYKDDKRLYKKPGPRLMFYGGFQKQYSWNLLNFKGKALALTHFPYCGHLDNPNNPRWDLNWGVSKKYYFGWQKLTQNTLFNQFWGNTIDELTDRNGHLLTINLILSELDMRNLDIRDIIQIDQVYYRINKITHNPLNSKAEAELIKVKGLRTYTAPAGLITSVAPDYVPDPADPNVVPTPKPPTPTPKPNPVLPTPGPMPGPWPNPVPTPWPGGEWDGAVFPIFDDEQRPWKTGGGSLTGGRPWSWNTTTTTGTVITTTSKPPSPWRASWDEVLPVTTWSGVLTNDWQANNSYSSMGSQRVQGRNNRVALTATHVSIQGNNNTIAEGARNIQVVGDNNIVAPNLTNVMVVGSNQFVSKSDVTVINGVEQPNRTTTTSSSRVLRSPSNSAGHTAKRIKGGANSADACAIVKGGQDTNSTDIPFIEWDDSVVMTPFGPKTA